MERAEQLRIPDPEEPLEGSLAETDPDRHHDHVQLIAEGAPYCTDGEELYVASDVDQVHDLPAMDTLADRFETVNIVNGEVIQVSAEQIHLFAAGQIASGQLTSARERIISIHALAEDGVPPDDVEVAKTWKVVADEL